MDPRWQLTDAPREPVSGVTAETPLVTIAWRVLRAEHKRRAEDRHAHEAEARRAQETLAKIAEQVHRLRQVVRALLAAPGESPQANQAQQLATIAERLDEALREADVAVIAPEGAPFTAELMDLFENIAQQPAAGLAEPCVAEVIKPAITHHGTLLRMGKAVIAIPLHAEGDAPAAPPAQETAVPGDAAPADAERAEQRAAEIA